MIVPSAYEKIGEDLYMAILLSSSWSPGARNATLLFLADGIEYSLDLIGIHLFSVRQSLFGPASVPLEESEFEDWYVHYFMINEHSKFLRLFLGHELGNDTRVVIYDTNSRELGTPGFSMPVHIEMLAGDAHFDIVCESVIHNS